jgi:hypothetical protein
MKKLGGALLVLLGAGAVGATTIHVQGDQPSIAAGLAAAQAGDTVLLACGNYLESNLEMASGVVLRGGSGDPLCTVIDAQGLGRVLACRAVDAATRIEGLTLTGGFVREGDNDAGGLWIAEGSAPVVADCRIEACNVDGGQFNCAHGLGVRDSSPSFLRCTIAGNGTSGDYGVAGGIACWNATLTLVDCDLIGNRGFQGLAGGLCCGAGSTVTAEDCRFTGNSATYHGAIAVEGATLHLIDCVLDHNETAYEGASLYADEALVTLTNCLVAGGHDADFSGGLYLENSTVAIMGSTITANRIDEGAWPGITGGGLWSIGSSVNLVESVLWGNCADSGIGHDAYISGGTVSFECCVVNPAEINGPATYIGLNFAEDPLFCAPAACGTGGGDYSLDGASICLPAHNGCGVQIGAFGHGCGQVGVATTSWSAVKAFY